MNFPEELLEELLIKVPLKFVTKFKCVSKDWSNIISDAEFGRRYRFRYRNSPRLCGFFYHHKNLHFSSRNPCMRVEGQAKFINTSSIKKQELGLCKDMQQLGYVIGSSKGLVLLSRNPLSYHVYDPLTKRHVRLPKVLKRYEFVCTGFICKELEQNRLNVITGCSSRYTYKVVRVVMPIPLEYTTTYKVETYSSETGKWRKSKMTCASNVFLRPHSTAKVIGGVLYWRNWGINGVIASDLEDSSGRATLINCPMPTGYELHTITGTQDGCLQCIMTQITKIYVWVLGSKYDGRKYLNEDVIFSDQWIISHTIDLQKLGFSYFDFGPNDDYVCFGHVIDIHPHNSNVIFLESSTEIVSYNLNEERVETRSLKREEQKPFILLDAYTYHYVEWSSWPCL